MQNIMLRIAYDGTAFAGYQEQENCRTVAGVLRGAVETLTGRSTRLIAAGRTDAGVHAEDQVVNFLTHLDWPADAFLYQLRCLLPDDLLLRSAQVAIPSFHARFAPHKTTYRYVVENGPYVLPTERHTVFSYTFPLNDALILEAARRLEGTHQFAAFSVPDPYRNSQRTVDAVTIERQATRLILRFTADGFLHRQVRFMTGAILLAGRGALDLCTLSAALEDPNAKPIAFCADAQGLVLEKIAYQ